MLRYFLTYPYMITIIAITVLIVLYMLYMMLDKNMEHMINIPRLNHKPTMNIGVCGRKSTSTYINSLNNSGIAQSNNGKWDIYIPCSYNDIKSEMQNIISSDQNKRLFIVDNADQLTSKFSIWNNLVKQYGRQYSCKLAPKTYGLFGNDLELLKSEYDSSKLYIMKKNIQRQHGLKITNNLDEMINGLKDGYVVVQELLQDPYLISGRKINLRFYVLIVCQYGEVNGYVYPDGFLYYTKEPFKQSIEDGPNITTGYIDRYIYKQNPLTHGDLRRYLDKPTRHFSDEEMKLLYNGHTLSNYAFSNMYKVLRDTIEAMQDNICVDDKYKSAISFQLFGADVALNYRLEAKIIEVNKGPDMGAKDGRDGELKKNVVGDMFKLLKIVPGESKWINIVG